MSKFKLTNRMENLHGHGQGFSSINERCNSRRGKLKWAQNWKYLRSHVNKALTKSHFQMVFSNCSVQRDTAGAIPLKQQTSHLASPREQVLCRVQQQHGVVICGHQNACAPTGHWHKRGNWSLIQRWNSDRCELKRVS